MWVEDVGIKNMEGRTPIAVDPSLMASREYSTWKRRPSGENVLGFDCVRKVAERRVREGVLDSSVCGELSLVLASFGGCGRAYHILTVQ